MRFRILAPLVILFALPGLTGCENTPKQRIQGKWVGERAEHFPASQADRAQGWVSGSSFEFDGSRVTVTIPAERPRQGTFKIKQATEAGLQLAFLRPHGTSDDVAFQFEGEGQLRWLLGDGRSILMRKAN
jgi:hypothetical protein